MDPYIPIFSTTSLFAVISILAPGCHRTLVFYGEEDYRIYSIFSESDLISSIYKLLHESQLQSTKNILDLPICTFEGVNSKPLRYVHADERIHQVVEKVLDFRKNRQVGSTPTNSTSAENNDQVTSADSASTCIPLVVVLNTQGALVGHFTHWNLRHFQATFNSIHPTADQQPP
uniref:Protein SDS23 n=1 Tax=Lygus hesperus TaxID=30085 RepID=A0A0A9Z0G9_LYGHE